MRPGARSGYHSNGRRLVRKQQRKKKTDRACPGTCLRMCVLATSRFLFSPFLLLVGAFLPVFTCFLACIGPGHITTRPLSCSSCITAALQQSSVYVKRRETKMQGGKREKKRPHSVRLRRIVYARKSVRSVFENELISKRVYIEREREIYIGVCYTHKKKKKKNWSMQCRGYPSRAA